MALNVAVVQGHLTTTPELHQTATGISVVSFTLAVDRNARVADTGEKIADFIDCVAFRGTAEFICRNFEKGRSMIAEGQVQTHRWEDKQGQSRKSTEIIIDRAYFGDSRRPAAETPERGSLPVGAEFAEVRLEDELPF